MSTPPDPVRPVEHAYATLPTPATRFFRTFIPWQMWRFVWINLKMVRIIARSHR
ncbi:MAG: hypothetical protein AB7H88_06885 [Vicinamibacterales bacterium]